MKAFRLLVVRVGLLLTVVLAAVAYGVRPIAAHGVLLGGLASIVAFWISARNMEKTHQKAEAAGKGEFANSPSNKLRFAACAGFGLRMVLYAVVLVKGYYLDKTHMWGFFGAAAGLLVVRLVVMGFGLTGWDLRGAKDSRNDG